MQVKVCGLKTAEQVEVCVEHGANFCGFILNYKKSHRFINYQTADRLTRIDKKNTAYVGVLVDPTIDELKIFSKLNLDYFQIYGDLGVKQLESIESEYNKKVIMALQIKEKKDVLKYKVYENSVDIILFDSSGLHESLSWNYNWIKSVPPSVTKMLAGNINMDMLQNLKKITDIVDVSGALETDKVKDIIKIKTFLEKIKLIHD
ncbi:phosphoribosylanthranilate isomerase [Pelagibacteraceae bacterium]|nr:phosphoribosylanthranilate isomerase [Pelagibacteraceae bacterium]